MLSHACASCGKCLGPTSRVYSAQVRMWIAKCPRCGFAVRWNPCNARAPFRLWWTFRALQTRIGFIQCSAGIAGGLSFAFGAYSLESMDYWERSPHALLFAPLLTMCKTSAVILIVLSALFATICALTMAPRRSALTRIAVAWGCFILPVTTFITAACTAAEERDYVWGQIARAFNGWGVGVLLLFAAPIVLSACFCFAAVVLERIVFRGLRARARRVHREASRGLAGERFA